MSSFQGRICPQDGGVCRENCASNFCAIEQLRTVLFAVQQERDEERNAAQALKARAFELEATLCAVAEERDALKIKNAKLRKELAVTRAALPEDEDEDE